MSSEQHSSEATREVSGKLLHRRPPLPMDQSRPMSRPSFQATDGDLEMLRCKAIEIGDRIANRGHINAKTQALAIRADQIVLDERVRWKCIIPLCFGYNSSPHCPPNSPTVGQMREIVAGYNSAIFFRYQPPVQDHVYPGFITDSARHVNALNEIVGNIEAEAGYLGYYLAMGFKGGPCCLCGIWDADVVMDFAQGKQCPICPVLRGQACNHYSRARPALEACGVDVFKTARNLGWETFIVQPGHARDAVPCVSWYGLVLVA